MWIGFEEDSVWKARCPYCDAVFPYDWTAQFYYCPRCGQKRHGREDKHTVTVREQKLKQASIEARL